MKVCTAVMCPKAATFRIDFLKSCCYPTFMSHVYCEDHTNTVVKNRVYDSRQLHVHYVGEERIQVI